MMVKVQSLAKGKEFCQNINLHIYIEACRSRGQNGREIDDDWKTSVAER